MPTTKKAVSFRPDPGVSRHFDRTLAKIQVDGDDRRAGFARRPADSITRTALLEALMRRANDQADALDPDLLRLPGLPEKAAAYRP